MKEQTCCLTGHRRLPEDFSSLRLRLKEAIKELAERGVKSYYCGGATGFDTLAGFAVIDAKKSRPELRLMLALPCEGQDRYWSLSQKNDYNKLLSAADETIYVSERYHTGCMLLRDRYMVDCSAFCLAYCTQKTGGTVYTVRYAQSRGLEVVNLASEWRQESMF